MQTVTIEEAQSRFSALIENLQPGEELVVTKGHQPVARIVRERTPYRKSRTPGSALGKLKVLQDDEEHLNDFRDYMP